VSSRRLDAAHPVSFPALMQCPTRRRIVPRPGTTTIAPRSATGCRRASRRPPAHGRGDRRRFRGATCRPAGQDDGLAGRSTRFGIAQFITPFPQRRPQGSRCSYRDGAPASARDSPIPTVPLTCPPSSRSCLAPAAPTRRGRSRTGSGWPEVPDDLPAIRFRPKQASRSSVRTRHRHPPR